MKNTVWTKREMKNCYIWTLLGSKMICYHLRLVRMIIKYHIGLDNLFIILLVWRARINRIKRSSFFRTHMLYLLNTVDQNRTVYYRKPSNFTSHLVTYQTMMRCLLSGSFLRNVGCPATAMVRRGDWREIQSNRGHKSIFRNTVKNVIQYPH